MGTPRARSRDASVDKPTQIFLDPAMRGAQSLVFRVAYFASEWGVAAEGQWLTGHDTQPDALRWLAGALLQLSIQPERKEAHG